MADGSAKSNPAAKRAPQSHLEHKTFKDGAIYLYRRSDYKKPTWFIRVKVPGAKGYVFKSSGTTDEHTAYSVAEALYLKSLVRVVTGGNLNPKRISDALNEYIRRYEPDRARLSVRYKVQLASRLVPTFQGMTFDQFDTASISKMLVDVAALSKRKSLSPNTIKRILTDFRHFLTWCIAERYLAEIPEFPTIAGDQARRPHFDSKDWQKLKNFMAEHLKAGRRSVRRHRRLLMYYVLILAETGIRVGEARKLKWKDLKQIISPNTPDVVHISLTVSGKTGYREVVASGPDVKDIFNQILKDRIKDLNNKSSDIFEAPIVPMESYIFCDSNGLPIGSFKKSFNALIEGAGVAVNTFGHRRTIYSLRHTYATSSLERGVNYYVLAQNMGTSVAMLEKYYGHTSNAAMVDELTKPKPLKRKATSGKVAAALDWLMD